MFFLVVMARISDAILNCCLMGKTVLSYVLKAVFLIVGQFKGCFLKKSGKLVRIFFKSMAYSIISF